MTWQPGDLTAAQMQDEWAEENGWAAQPPAALLDMWRATSRAEETYWRSHVAQVDNSAASIGSQLPDLAIIPAHPRVDGTKGFDIELATSKGHTVLLCFSTVGALVDMLGSYQPWVGLPPADLAAVHMGIPIVLDPTPGVVDAEWTAGRLAALEEILDK
ncbi:hypothetical protein [Williamsia herbipolensis]|uniref:hypothetical protein n=1 Tax=Williamsia herbipolensis TaxID=1603258 RepID=UPI0005F85110|nr:hypothetical protein [Williamsia herbipolensis]